MSSPRTDEAGVHNDGSALSAENTAPNQRQKHSAQERNSSFTGKEKKSYQQNSGHGAVGASELDFLKPWLMEVVACVLVLLAIMAIVLTLALHQNQPLPNWPFGISVNSLVSIFVVILKGGMLLILSEGS